MWLAAADRKVQNAWFFRHEFADIVAKATGQYRRAATATRRLRAPANRGISGRHADEALGSKEPAG